MAKQRMFSLDIVDCDEFLDLDPRIQTLYFHLGMRADDDGVVNNYRMIMRFCNCTENDLALLIKKKYIIPVQAGDSRVMVIKHWKMANKIPKDRYTPSKYKSIVECLDIDENGAYRLPDQGCIRSVYEDYMSMVQTCNGFGTDLVQKCNGLGTEMYTQDSIGKVSKESILYPILSQSKHYQAALNREPGVLRLKGLTQDMLDEADEDKELKEFK